MPNSTWKDKTCEKCVFRVSGECRRFPPDTAHGYPGVADFIWEIDEITGAVIHMNKAEKVSGYHAACAEYAESLNSPDHSCPKCGHWMITSPEHPSRYCTKCGEGF